MALINTNLEKAAKILAEADDEVLQTAGLMSLMRLETLNKRLRGFDTGGKPLTPISLQNESAAADIRTPSPWWQKTTPKTSQVYKISPNYFTLETALFQGGTFDTSEFSNFSTTGISQQKFQPITTLFGQTQSQTATGSLSLDATNKSISSQTQTVPTTTVSTQPRNGSSPKTSIDFKIVDTKVQSADVTSSDSLNSPQTSFHFKAMTPTVQTTKADFSNLFSSPKSSLDLNTTTTAVASSNLFSIPKTTTVQSGNTVSSNLLGSPKINFDLKNTATTVQTTNVASSNLISSHKSSSDLYTTAKTVQSTNVTSSELSSSSKSTPVQSTTVSFSNLFNRPTTTFDFNMAATKVVSSTSLGNPKGHGDMITNPKIVTSNVTTFPGRSSASGCDLSTQTCSTTVTTTNTTRLNKLPKDNSGFRSNSKTQTNPVATSTKYVTNVTSNLTKNPESRSHSPHRERSTKSESRPSSSSSSLSDSSFKEEKLPKKELKLRELDLEYSEALSRESRRKSADPKQWTHDRKSEYVETEEDNARRNHISTFNRQNLITNIRRIEEDVKSSSPVVSIKSLERDFDNLQIDRNRRPTSTVSVRNTERRNEETRQLSTHDLRNSSITTVQRKIEDRHLEANFFGSFQNFSPVYNIYKTYNQSVNFNYPEPRQSLPTINNIYVNVDSRFGLGYGSLPATSGGCRCRQIQCADRRCGCNKAGTSCHGGCLCSSRGGWCLNR